MSIQEEYEAVNAMLKHMGIDPIPLSDSGSDGEKLQRLVDSYLATLITKVPRYAGLNPRLIPDMILQHLLESMNKMN